MDAPTIQRIVNGKSYEDNLREGLAAIEANLQYLVNNDKINQRSADRQNLALNQIRAGANTMKAYITELEYQLREWAGRYDELEVKKLKLEAVCLIHGITDLPAWMAKSRELLIQLTIQSVAEKWAQIPARILETNDPEAVNEVLTTRKIY